VKRTARLRSRFDRGKGAGSQAGRDLLRLGGLRAAPTARGRGEARPLSGYPTVIESGRPVLLRPRQIAGGKLFPDVRKPLTNFDSPNAANELNDCHEASLLFQASRRGLYGSHLETRAGSPSTLCDQDLPQVVNVR
jgi:hypothetical protein